MSLAIKRQELQQKLEWDLDKDLPWHLGCDPEKDLIPVGDDFKLFSIEGNKRKTVSKILGLIAASAVSEHEKVINQLKGSCWEKPLKYHEAPEEFYVQGEQFFKEEEKHSAAFNRFLSSFAEAHNITLNELKSFLPHYSNSSFNAFVFRINSLFGGKTIWWTVAATELESILLFKMMSNDEKTIDPLFYRLNRLHFEEEVRHSSYAFKVLNQLGKKSKIEFHLSRALQTIWVFSQLRRFEKVEKLKGRHPFFDEAIELLEEFRKISFFKRIKILFNDSSYISIMLNPQKHAKIRKELARTGNV